MGSWTLPCCRTMNSQPWSKYCEKLLQKSPAAQNKWTGCPTSAGPQLWTLAFESLQKDNSLGKEHPLGKGWLPGMILEKGHPLQKGGWSIRGAPWERGSCHPLRKGNNGPWQRTPLEKGMGGADPWQRMPLEKGTPWHNHCKRIALAKGQLPRLALEKGCPLKKGVCHKQSLRKDVPCKREIAKINPWERMLLNAKGNPLQKGTATLALELFGHPLGKGKIPALILAKG